MILGAIDIPKHISPIFKGEQIFLKSVSKFANLNLLRNTKPIAMKDNLDLCGNGKDYIVHFIRQRQFFQAISCWFFKDRCEAIIFPDEQVEGERQICYSYCSCTYCCCSCNIHCCQFVLTTWEFSEPMIILCFHGAMKEKSFQSTTA